MSEYLPFIQQNWLMFAVFGISFVFVIVLEGRNRASKGFRLDVQQTTFEINRHNAVVVDIRSASQFDLGHIIDAKNILAEAIKQDSSCLDALKQLKIILVCDQGLTAAGLSGQLRKKEFDTYYLEGGLNKWKQADMPLVKS